jgi:hypothetical protein
MICVINISEEESIHFHVHEPSELLLAFAK